ncbi:MAG: hypothetical protein HY918_01735, partial [Candidatus Doudnabacteria bacterium]|nr:hypothetical protein [Candidatus Doudnabacteria bacterium]
MKKILLLGLVALFFFTIEAQEVKAGVVFEQTQANGYWLSDGGYAFFCGSGTECEKITQYNISPGILTNFNGSRAFTSTGENVIKTVSLSLAKQPAMADPGRLIMWCDGFESNYFFYSTQSLKASDLEVDSFKNFQFDFPHSPCKMPRGFLFEMAGGFSDMKVEAVKADNKPFYGIGHIQWAGGPDGFGSPTGYESYEPYIQVSEGSYEPYTPPCDTGYKTSGYDEAPLPTYDYDQTDGLVKFHFKTNGSQFTYRRFNNVCELQYPVLWSQKGDLFNYTPATNNIMIQAKEVKDESGNFLYYSWKAFNEDNGQELPISLDDSRLAFTDPVMSIGFFSYIGYPNSTPYFEYSYFSPAVWVKDPNFVPNPTPTKTPVLIIPGTLGTEIWKGDNRLWMDIDKMKNPVDSDSFMDPMSFKADGTPLDTSLKLGSVLTLPHSSFNYSQKLIDDLSDNGYDLNKSVFLFPYDWRDDIQKNSNIFLKEKIDEIIASSSASKIDVIAHSQGGLLIKRLLFNHPEYVSKINNLVFVGTPNLGSPKSVKILVYGDDLGVRRFGVELLNSGEIKKISQNMPAIYQMLPSREYFNHSSGYLGQYIYNLDSKYGQISSSFDETKNIIKKATYNLNSDQIDKADSFHSAEFDNLDLTGSGIKAYNIMGCESPTIDRVYINGSDGKDDVQYGPG